MKTSLDMSGDTCVMILHSIDPPTPAEIEKAHNPRALILSARIYQSGMGEGSSEKGGPDYWQPCSRPDITQHTKDHNTVLYR
jgi:hypothetical protein